MWDLSWGYHHRWQFTFSLKWVLGTELLKHHPQPQKLVAIFLFMEHREQLFFSYPVLNTYFAYTILWLVNVLVPLVYIQIWWDFSASIYFVLIFLVGHDFVGIELAEMSFAEGTLWVWNEEHLHQNNCELITSLCQRTNDCLEILHAVGVLCVWFPCNPAGIPFVWFPWNFFR